jgi:uncharacterized damage-inducible protein DinB
MTYYNLEEIFTDKVRILATLEKTVLPLSASQLAFRPAPGVWSVAEVVEHVSIVETGLIRLVRSLTEKAESVPGTIPAPFEVTLDDGLGSGKTGKIRTRPEFEPKGNVPLAESLHTLRGVQTGLLDLRPRLEAVEVSSVKFPHRALGDMSLGQWLAFIGAHEARHLGQIRTVISSAGSRADILSGAIAGVIQ